MQADRCLGAGNLDGKAVWMRVIRAIEELQDRRPLDTLCISAVLRLAFSRIEPTDLPSHI